MKVHRYLSFGGEIASPKVSQREVSSLVLRRLFPYRRAWSSESVEVNTEGKIRQP